jgi:hypothetical protein
MKGRHHRWEEQLNQLDLKLTYREGRANIVPDALSRRPDLKDPEPLDTKPHPPLSTASNDPSSVPYSARDLAEFKHATRPSAETNPQPTANISTVSSVDPDRAFLATVREHTGTDPYAQMAISRMILADTQFASFSLNDDLLYNNNQLYIPPNPALHTQVLQSTHNSHLAGHLGTDKTYELTARTFYWPEMQQDVRAFVRTCDKCIHNKASNRPPGGLLQPIPIPHQRWEQVTMDLIV